MFRLFSSDEVLQRLISDKMCLLQDQKSKQTSWISEKQSIDTRSVCCSESTKVPTKYRNVHEIKKPKTTYL